MKEYSSIGSDGNTTITVTAYMDDAPPLSKEERDEAERQAIVDAIYNIVKGLWWTGIAMLIIVICQIAQCAHTLLK